MKYQPKGWSYNKVVLTKNVTNCRFYSVLTFQPCQSRRLPYRASETFAIFPDLSHFWKSTTVLMEKVQFQFQLKILQADLSNRRTTALKGKQTNFFIFFSHLPWQLTRLTENQIAAKPLALSYWKFTRIFTRHTAFSLKKLQVDISISMATALKRSSVTEFRDFYVGIYHVFFGVKNGLPEQL